MKILKTMVGTAAVLFCFLLFVAMRSERQQAMTSNHARIVDGPAYLAQQAAAKKSTEDSTISSEPPSDGSDVAVDPDSMPSQQDGRAMALAAMKSSPDVGTRILGPGQIMVLMPYGPCGTIDKGPTGFIWATDAGNVIYDDLYGAVAAAVPECEQAFLVQKKAREAAQSPNAGPAEN